MKTVPVLLLTGYLGSGKTTLLNRILQNKRDIKFAVIVNDIGEVNIDASLIERGGVVGQKDGSMVALQNGCICCTLKMDLVEQVNDILRMERFDYIVIEASGICEPEPIAQTLCSIPQMGPQYTEHGFVRLDCVTTVVDALRLESEFSCGDRLTRNDIGEEDIENLIVQQIEFCNMVLLNKASEVQPAELGRIRQIIHTLQPQAEIIECDYCDVPLERLLDTHLFNFDRVMLSAAWIQEIERPITEEQQAEAHGHHHHDDHDDDHDDDAHDTHDTHDAHDTHDHHGHHHHHHDGGEVEEYGIGTYVYYRRPAFNLDRFDDFVARRWPRNVIRAKGVCYFNENPDMSFLFEQAGVQKTIKEAGLWFATATEDDLRVMMERDPNLKRDWDERYGDRMQKLVFIGQNLDREALARELDACLESE
ncbi:MAG: GTP-binding protein [Prevotella sp.]|nr:GTP-binding protein [Prevotella sp.]